VSGLDDVRVRIVDLGSCALLAFDGDDHVGQLQFRRYEAGGRSPNGIWTPRYWMDFDGHAPALPPDTICLSCFHIGQLDDTAARDERYQDRGIAAALLHHFLEWARARRIGAVIVKATPPHRPVMDLLGGLPAPAYEARGFDTVVRWVDPDLAQVVRDRALVAESDRASASTVACCVLRPGG
jgi:GNAT superfamily N-acetyltransferase